MVVATFGCHSSSSKPTSSSDSSAVTAAYDGLVRALVACGRQAGACAKSGASDSIALAACHDKLNQCRDDVANMATRALADAIHACTDMAQDCEKRATSATAKDSCRDALKSCLDRTAPAKDDDDDGGESPAVDISECVDALHACVESGTEPATCADEMRSCVLAAVPVPKDVMPGEPDDNSMQAHPDAGRPNEVHDAGMSTAAHPDAGRPPDTSSMRDAGASTMEPPPVDAGMKNEKNDAGDGSCTTKHGQGCHDAGHGKQQ